MKYFIFLPIVFLSVLSYSQVANSNNYLQDLKQELQTEWPKNRTINVVFHGHSVPAGYFKTPAVNTTASARRPQKHFLCTIVGPDSSYSDFEIHICWKVLKDERIEPPIHA